MTFILTLLKKLGLNTSLNSASHPSIDAIKSNGPSEGYQSFDVRPVNKDIVLKKINSLSTKKATGIDHIPPTIVKSGAEVIANPICNISINVFIYTSFPTDLKWHRSVQFLKRMTLLSNRITDLLVFYLHIPKYSKV